jgi:hypothetical protein
VLRMMQLSMRSWFSILLAVGCGGEDPDPNACIPDLIAYRGNGETNAQVDVGTGRDAFEDLTDNGVIPLIHGPQGGYHLLLNARVYDMETGDPLDYASGPLTLFSVFANDNERLDLFTCAIEFPYVASGAGYQLDRSLAVILPNELVPAIYGQTVRARVEVLDRNDRFGVEEVDVVVIDPEANQSAR